jgi:hypothetical protein
LSAILIASSFANLAIHQNPSTDVFIAETFQRINRRKSGNSLCLQALRPHANRDDGAGWGESTALGTAGGLVHELTSSAATFGDKIWGWHFGFS